MQWKSRALEIGKVEEGGGMDEGSTSARVGVGYSIMDCSRCEATMTALPACRHRTTTSFWTEGTSSRGICAPADACQASPSSHVQQSIVFLLPLWVPAKAEAQHAMPLFQDCHGTLGSWADL